MAHSVNGAIPQYLEPQPLYPFGCESALAGNDFIMVAEFAEVEGPRPVKLISSGLPSGVDVNHLAMKVLPVDHHFYHPRDSFAVAKDMQLLMSDSQFDLTLLVHSFKLYDIAARGYVRPMCVTYGSRDHHKMTFFYEELSKLLYEAVGLMEESNRMVFLNDLERHYASLLRLLELYRRQCHTPAACLSANAGAKDGERLEANDSSLMTEQQLQEKEQQLQEKEQQLLKNERENAEEEEEEQQQQLKMRRQQSQAIESALSEIGQVISGLGGKPDREAELALPAWDAEQPAAAFSDSEITAMSTMLLHKPAHSDLYDVDELCPKVGDVWKLLEAVHEYYQRTTCEILCHKTDFLISAPMSGLLVRGTGEPLVNCLLSLNGEQRALFSDMRDASLDDDTSLNDQFYSVGSDAAGGWCASLTATAVASATAAAGTATHSAAGTATHSAAAGSEHKIARATAATGETPMPTVGRASADIISGLSYSSGDVDRSILSSAGEWLKNSPDVPGNGRSGLDRCASDAGWTPVYTDDRKLEPLHVDHTRPPVPEPSQPMNDLADEAGSLSVREQCCCVESCSSRGGGSCCCGSQSEGGRTLREASPAESLVATAVPQQALLKEDAGSSTWSDDVDGSVDSGGDRILGWSQSLIGWSSSSTTAAASLPSSRFQLTARPHLTSEVPADMQAFLRKPEGAARLNSVHAGVLLRLSVELSFFPVLVYSLLIGRPVVIVADVDSLPRSDESCSSSAGSATPSANPGRPLDQQLLAVVRALETLVPRGGCRSQAVAASASNDGVDDCISKCVYQSRVASSNSQHDKIAKQSAAARQARTVGHKLSHQRTSTISYPVSLSDACQYKIIGVFREKSAADATPNPAGDADFSVAAQNVLNHVTVLNLSTKCLRGPTYTGSLHADLRRFRKEKELHRAEALRLYFDRVISAFAMKAFVLHHLTCRFWDSELSEQGARSQYAAKRKGILRGLHLHVDDAEIVQYMANLVDRQQTECYLQRTWKNGIAPDGSVGRLTAPWMNVSNQPCKVYGRRSLLSTYLFKR